MMSGAVCFAHVGPAIADRRNGSGRLDGRTLCVRRDAAVGSWSSRRSHKFQGYRGSRLRMSAEADSPPIMVNGVPGGMAAETAEAVVRRGLTLVPYALTGPDVEEETADISGTVVKLMKPEDRDSILASVKKDYPGVVCVDFTHPTAVNGNVKAYSEQGLDSVVGTTGGDVAAMKSDVLSNPDVYSVIAPNMGKQIVAFQAMMKMFSSEFPEVFKGYKLEVVESHQSWKADTSGTAKAVIASINDLGVPFSVEEVEKVRTAPEQLGRMQVPEDYLTGHAYHTYTLTSPDGTVTIEFKHNVRGRKVYAEGTVDAAVWLSEKRSKKSEQKIFDMIDILRSGKMR